VEDGIVRCYACGACGTVVGDAAFDFTLQRSAWPRIECFLTPGCSGLLVPEALN
jgi:hypothetical protein